MSGILSEFRHRLGWLPRRKGKAVIVLANGAAAVARCRSVVDELARRFPRVNLLWVAGEGVAAGALPAPWRAGFARRLFLGRAKARLVVACGPLAPAHRGLLECARAAGVDAVDLAVDEVGTDEVAARLEAHLAAGPSRRPRLRGLHGVACRVASGLGPCLRDVEALRSHLDEPDSILCLGNGPSSEDPRLEGVVCDALFRVNHMWSDRAAFTAPQVVFTGLRSAIRALGGGPVFLAQTRDDERRLALMRMVTTRRVRTASAEALGLLPTGITPTNGAVMLAVAAALKPGKIVIAGMDLFRHPTGAYPGDSKTANAYAPLHDPDEELDYILSVLDGYRGELVILSDALAHEWERHVDRRDRELAVRGA